MAIARYVASSTLSRIRALALLSISQSQLYTLLSVTRQQQQNPNLPPNFSLIRHISTSTSLSIRHNTRAEVKTELESNDNFNLNPNLRTKTRTPMEKQFETWVDKLKPKFTPDDVNEALKSQSDPDLALDIFRWSALQRNYKHNHITYLTMIQIVASGKQFKHTETLIDEVLAGACAVNLPLYNYMIQYCCSRKPLFNRAFDVYKKLLNSKECKPSLETFTMLLNTILRRFSKLNVSYVYLHAVRSLLKQMKISGVIPDTVALNYIIKAYSMCLDMDEAIKVYQEMGLYGCEPNEYTYSYLAKGLCEKGRVSEGVDYYKEMREKKGLVPTSSTYMILICSLSMERRYEEATEIMFDMLKNSMVPDLLTYKTLLEGICREGKEDEAFELLEEVRKKQGSMGDRTYKNILNGLHFVSQE
ncbi:hypothetical protein C5167_022908 [Papaver somniferum]|uniref:Pentacotripeptide-repeat region of PRORP domain-containing protein n=1 Tax=Papaver somniferum TaxID=3469 RepID=A0A4Y7JN89_PAPSO|nr:pentatricopeptide repeat-containing protein At3g25210, mitochondrial-like [Papaver somniferum]RZC61145.1 hypothetical protein C5167_022908 [Papaver somniferum]